MGCESKRCCGCKSREDMRENPLVVEEPQIVEKGWGI